MKPIEISGEIAFRAEDLGWKGSQQRCLLITSMGKEKLQEILLKIIGEETVEKLGIKFPEKFEYYPKGFPNPNEIELDKVELPINVDFNYCKELNRWWLKRSAKTPTWDLVCNAEINEEQGLILVEAKAHKGELINTSDKLEAEKGSQNYIKITEALYEVSKLYGYELKYEECYQMSNRIAWSIKLASIGIPVVLIYLGFINTEEMKTSITSKDTLITSSEQWRDMVIECSNNIGFNSSCWEEKRNGDEPLNNNKDISEIGDKPKYSFFYPIIRAANVQLHCGKMSITCGDPNEEQE